MAAAKRVLIFGGNGFVGSSITKSAVARGWQVTSCSRSGSPYKTPAGFHPAWVEKVEWRKGTPFDRASYEHLLSQSDAVISTLGILLETDYKSSGSVNPLSVLRGALGNVLGDRGNPLRRGREDQSYERMNRDAALEIYQALRETPPRSSRAAFVFLSAEDIFRPFVDSRYISTKREAEQVIRDSPKDGRLIRPIFVRPGLIYHPLIQPISTLPATFLSATSNLLSLVPPHLRPPPASPSTSSTSLASMFSTPPIHVDTIGESICMAIEDETIEGVLDVKRMRKMIGFDEMYDSNQQPSTGGAHVL